MAYLTFTDTHTSQYPVCFLVTSIMKSDIVREYIDPHGVPRNEVLVLDLFQEQGKKKTAVKLIKEYVESELVPTLQDQGVEYIMCSDSEYFKVLTGQAKVEANLGYAMDCKYGPWKVFYVPSYRAVFYDPIKIKAKIKQGIDAMMQHKAGLYLPPGNEVIKFEYYPETPTQIADALDKLLKMDCDLTCDIEAFDLKPHRAGIGTITFCWNKHEGLAFCVDYEEIPGATTAPFGRNVKNVHVRNLLLDFFRKFRKSGRKMIYHNIAFDVNVLIYQLFMQNIIDTVGLLTGIDYMLTNWDCTKLISYLAHNSCSGNKNGLKDQAQEFAGNYAVEEIKDITMLPKQVLLRYNLVDGLSTWFVHGKNHPKMVADQQEQIYREIFQPATLDIVQMQLTGLPIDMARVKEVRAELEADEKDALDRLMKTKIVEEFNYHLLEKFTRKKNEEWKKKTATMDEMLEAAKTSPAIAKAIAFNPNSDDQLRVLLYDQLGLPVIEKTKSKQPSTNKKTLKALKHHTQDQAVKDFLDAMLDYVAVNKILTSFIPAMEDAVPGPDGWHYLLGNFNLGGTVSGRLSSSNPNLQNLPANSKYAKLIKSCVRPPPGWLFCGLDFASLEDRISALTTKDPEKLKVYTMGFDGHAMRAVAYWGHKMTGIDKDDPASVNTITDKSHPYFSMRQDSKAPTFALTYQGTHVTLMKNCGFTKEEAMLIEANYKKLYKVSIEWVAEKLERATRDGYVTTAFGLRVRTPLLHQVVLGTSKTPSEAEAEGRTAGNALGQGWCLLNSRAWSEFMGKVRKSEFAHQIRPCAQIHDAGYALIKDNIKAVHYTNIHLVEAVQWQDHPDIAHDEVKLGGELGIFHPTWAKEITIANGATEEEILDTVKQALAA
ncbi:MAG: DNA polymerase family A [Podoviridae sp. ctda_1]|nr:MAG: DNA polymerase family A [Podoviridae sp. ctda_1]